MNLDFLRGMNSSTSNVPVGLFPVVTSVDTLLSPSASPLVAMEQTYVLSLQLRKLSARPI
jgi:hypothetical protein